MSELKDFKCPTCGARLEFDSKTQKLKCPYCEGMYDPDTFDSSENFDIKSDKWNGNELEVYTCNSCGGAIMADINTVAKTCPYCGNPVVLQGNISGDYKPSRIIPFKLNKEDAKTLYRKHLQGKILLPKTFSNEAIIDEIKGVYVPFWLFDGSCNAQIWYDATKVRTWSDSDYDYVETSYYKLFRAGRVKFEDVPVDASTMIDDQFSQSIEPFDSVDLVNFNANYLAGYLADKYDVSAKECEDIAYDRIYNSTQALFQSTTSGFATAVPTAKNMILKNGTQEYVMMPMWLLNVKYNNKNYKFAMNGQTGKFVGDLPMDKTKFFLIAILILIGVALIAIAVQYFMMGGQL
ncbi:MAG: hypothetical protein IJH31_03395 [Erysipelotrichaceae bacterium]|nr:hypothetical protein [Erysipelotrichaceae bacterium]